MKNVCYRTHQGTLYLIQTHQPCIYLILRVISTGTLALRKIVFAAHGNSRPTKAVHIRYYSPGRIGTGFDLHCATLKVMQLYLSFERLKMMLAV